MPVTVKIAVQQEPLSLLEVKAHLRIDFPDDDLYLAGLISQVREFAEQETRRSLAPQTLQDLTQIPLLPAGALSGPIGWRPSEIEIYMPPIDTVSLLEGETSPGLFQTIDPVNYLVDTATSPGYIYLLSSAYSFLSSQWTLWSGPYTPRFRITYTAGYNGMNTIPIPFLLKRAMLELLAYWYDFRQGRDDTSRYQITIPLGIQSKLDKYRVFYGAGGGI